MLVSLMQLAIAIVYDLGIDKPPIYDSALTLVYEFKGISRPPGSLRSPTIEERRALLGCYVMSSLQV
jgi:hypothetical protein